MQKMVKFIEERRKRQEIPREHLAKLFKMSLRTYNARLRDGNFTIPQLMEAGRVLRFDITLLPEEADIFTAGTLS